MNKNTICLYHLRRPSPDDGRQVADRAPTVLWHLGGDAHGAGTRRCLMQQERWSVASPMTRSSAIPAARQFRSAEPPCLAVRPITAYCRSRTSLTRQFPA